MPVCGCGLVYVRVCAPFDMGRYVLSYIQASAMTKTKLAALQDIGLSADNGAQLSWSAHHPAAPSTEHGPLRELPLGSGGVRVWQYTSPKVLEEVGARCCAWGSYLYCVDTFYARLLHGFQYQGRAWRV